MRECECVKANESVSVSILLSTLSFDLGKISILKFYLVKKQKKTSQKFSPIKKMSIFKSSATIISYGIPWWRLQSPQLLQ